MDGLEAQYGGYFIKNIRKLAFFEKKMLKNLQVSKNILHICNMKNLLAGDIHRQQELSGDKKLRHLRTIRTKWS